MTDQIESFGASLIQHGPANDRVYLMKLAPQDLPALPTELEQFAEQAGYGKVFAKVPADAEAVFCAEGYQVEAKIPDFYRGEQAAVFLGRYLDPARAEEQRPELVQQVLDAARAKAGDASAQPLPEALTCRPAGPDDAEAMVRVYRQVFASYPFPIHDPGYLRETLADNVAYFGVWDGEQPVALASAEMDQSGQNAEMTDFATLPAWRGQGLAHQLLQQMEEEMPARGIQTLYTIARAYSHGMNITFARNGYRYSGTLTHNTQISGDLESMNVWYKPLAEAGQQP